jgi:hypothetical protein
MQNGDLLYRLQQLLHQSQQSAQQQAPLQGSMQHAAQQQQQQQSVPAQQQQQQQQQASMPHTQHMPGSVDVDALLDSILSSGPELQDLLQPMQQQQPPLQQSAPWYQQPMQQQQQQQCQQQAGVHQQPVQQQEQQQQGVQGLRSLGGLSSASVPECQQPMQQQQQRQQQAPVHQQPVQQHQEQQHLQQPPGVQGLRSIDDILFASLQSSLTAGAGMVGLDAAAGLQQLLQAQQQQQQQQQEVQFQPGGGSGSRPGSKPKRPARRKAGAAAAAAAAAVTNAAAAAVVDDVGGEGDAGCDGGDRPRKRGRASKTSAQTQGQRAAPRSAADVPAREGPAGPTNTAAGAAAAAAAGSAEGGGTDEAGGERSSSGKGPVRAKRKGCTQGQLERQYAQFSYFNNPKELNDANRKKFDRGVEDLCQLTFCNTVCSHNALKGASKLQILLHQAQFLVIYMAADGQLRCALSPDWQQSVEVQELFEALLQACRQHWYDADAGDTIIEPSMYEAQQRLPPTLGLHDLQSRVGHLALKHAVYNISRLYAADWQDEQATLHKAGEEAVQPAILLV